MANTSSLSVAPVQLQQAIILDPPKPSEMEKYMKDYGIKYLDRRRWHRFEWKNYALTYRGITRLGAWILGNAVEFQQKDGYDAVGVTTWRILMDEAAESYQIAVGPPVKTLGKDGFLPHNSEDEDKDEDLRIMACYIDEGRLLKAFFPGAPTIENTKEYWGKYGDIPGRKNHEWYWYRKTGLRAKNWFAAWSMGKLIEFCQAYSGNAWDQPGHKVRLENFNWAGKQGWFNCDVYGDFPTEDDGKLGEKDGVDGYDADTDKDDGFVIVQVTEKSKIRFYVV